MKKLKKFYVDSFLEANPEHANQVADLKSLIIETVSRQILLSFFLLFNPNDASDVLILVLR